MDPRFRGGDCFGAILARAGRDLPQRRRQRPADGTRLRADGARPVGDLRRGARGEFRARRDDDARHVPDAGAVRGAQARPAGAASAGRRGAVRLRLPAAGRADQPVHQPAGAQPVHAIGGGRADSRQRAAHRFRPGRAGRAHGLLLRQLPARAADRRRRQGLRRGRGAAGGRGAVRLLPLHAAWQVDPRLRRQLRGRARGRPEREAALRAHLRPGRGLRRRRRRHAGGGGRRDAVHRPGLHAARVRHRHHRRAGLDDGRAARRAAHRPDRGAGRRAVRAFGEEHVRFRAAGAGAAVSPARHPRQEGLVKLLEGVPRRGAILLAVLLALLVVFPMFASGYLLAVGFLILYYAYVGQAWNIMMGFAGQLSLGHSLYVGLGAYAAAALYVHFGLSPWIGLAASLAVCALAGALIGFLAFRFGVGGVYFAILTIAFAEFARIGFDHFAWVRGSSGLFLPVANYTENDLWNLRGSPRMFYYLMLALTVGAFVLCHALLRSRMGYYWLAIRESPEAAQALGVNLFRYKMAAVILSAAMTALAGVVFAFYYNNLFPEQIFHISRSIELILGPIIGGIGTLVGPLVGALLITGLAEGMRELMLQLGIDVPGVKQVFYGVCLLLVVMFLPEGVWPPLAKKLRLDR